MLDHVLWSRQGYLYKPSTYGGALNGEISVFSRAIWSDFFKKPVDQRPNDGREILKIIRNYYFKAQWHEIYEFIEFVVKYYRTNRVLTSGINNVLERELAGYRIIDGVVAPVTSQLEVEAVEQALELPFEGSRKHVKQALISFQANQSLTIETP